MHEKDSLSLSLKGSSLVKCDKEHHPVCHARTGLLHTQHAKIWFSPNQSHLFPFFFAHTIVRKPYCRMPWLFDSLYILSCSAADMVDVSTCIMRKAILTRPAQSCTDQRLPRTFRGTHDASPRAVSAFLQQHIKSRHVHFFIYDNVSLLLPQHIRSRHVHFSVYDNVSLQCSDR
jgi:hypothetical protein